MPIEFTHGKPGSFMTFSTDRSDATEEVRAAVRFCRSVNIGANRFVGTPPLTALENYWNQLYGIAQIQRSEELRVYRDCVHRMCNALRDGLHSGPVKVSVKSEPVQSGA